MKNFLVLPSMGTSRLRPLLCSAFVLSGLFSLAAFAADSPALTVVVAAPADGATVQDTVSVSASVSSRSPVAGVRFAVDGVCLGSEITAPPYAVSWDTRHASNAHHVLTAVARDQAHHEVTSAGAIVLVNNPPPPASHPPLVGYQNDFSANATGWTASAGDWTVSSGAFGGSSIGEYQAVYTGDEAHWDRDYTLRVAARSSETGANAQLGVFFNYVDAGNYYKVVVAADGSAQLLKRIGGGAEQLVASGSYFGYFSGVGVSPWIDLEVQRIGANTLVRANGSRLFPPTVLAELGAGTIGLAASGTVPTFDNVSVTLTPTVAYRQQFATPASDWKAVSGAWQQTGGVCASTSNSGHAVMLYNADTWLTEYTCSISALSSWSNPAAKIGVVYNYLDSANYSEVLLHGDGTAEINRVVSGETTPQGTASYVGAGANRWVDITVLRHGGATTVNVNGRRVFTDIDQSELGPGKIGFVAVTDNSAKFDEVVVTDGLDPYKHTFPKIAGVFIGGNQPWNTTTPVSDSPRDRAAKHDVVLVNTWRVWGGGEGAAATAMQAIKNLNPALVIASYTDVMETAATGGGAEPEVVAKLDAGTGPNFLGDWWARDVNGNKTAEFSGTFMTNVTQFVYPDAEGRRFTQWDAEWYNTHKFALIPQFDFMYEDNIWMTTPRYILSGYNPPDWNRDGTPDAWNQNLSSLPNLHFRTGMAAYYGRFAQLRPTLLQMGNVGGQSAGFGIPTYPLQTAEYQFLINGALYEAPMGKGYSDETFAGWHKMMAGYNSLVDNTKWPHLVWMAARGLANGQPVNQPNGTSQGQPFPAGYAFMRYALASVLMDDGYFAFNGDAYDVAAYRWFDELNLQLGRAIGAPVRTPTWTTGPAAGAFMRRFQNGAALVNPRQEPQPSRANRGPVTIDLTGQGYRRFVGTQDPANDGSIVTTITLQAGDGVILVRE